MADVQAIKAYIARHSRKYAHAMVEKLFACSVRLQLHTHLGRVVPEYNDEMLRELFEDPYRMVYRIGEGQIDIIAVIHAARRLPRGLSSQR